MAASADEHHTQVQQVQDNPQYSEQYKRELIAEARAAFAEAHRDARDSALVALDTAAQAAARRLSSPADDATETRKARAAMRVSRLIDGGQSAMLAATTFAELGDIDALRALRDEVPSLVMSTLPPSEHGRRHELIDAMLLEVDRRMAPLVSGDDAAAVRVRLTVADERTRLDAVTNNALNPSAMSRLTLAYATTEG
jgi:hypothetical protein